MIKKDISKKYTRTQLRLPQKLYQELVNYAEINNLSLNSAILELLSKGSKFPSNLIFRLNHRNILDNDDIIENTTNFKIIHLSNGVKRIISGQLMYKFILDYNTIDLTELKSGIEHCIEAILNTKRLKSQFQNFLPQGNISVKLEEQRLDIINEYGHSLNWITVEDYI